MKRYLLLAIEITVAALLCGAALTTALGQQPNPPHVAFVYPAGGRQGTTVTVYLGGQSLTRASAVYLSGEGVQAKVVGYDLPLAGKELNDARERLQQLLEKRAAAYGLPPPPNLTGVPRAAAPSATPKAAPAAKPEFTEADRAEALKLSAKVRSAAAARQASPALVETVLLQVTFSADAKPGDRELRLLTAAGLSNPVIFCVGQLPEFSKPVVTATTAPIDPTQLKKQPKRPAGQAPAKAPAEMAIELPATVNGQIMPGKVDRFRFSAKKGERLTIAVRARSLIPYLADAVPGWFKPTLALYDGKGREVAYDDNFRFDPDPVIFYSVPADGDYTMEIKDSIYRGREDFVYRITVGEVPHLTDVFPLGGKAGECTDCALSGWNLPSGTHRVDASGMSSGSATVSVTVGGIASNTLKFGLDALPECRADGANHSVATAQPLELPVIVDGRVSRPDEREVYRFEGNAGAEVVAEVCARRLGSPLDSALTLTDASGRRLAFNDDFEDVGEGLITHQADSRLSVKLPSDGTYYLTLVDVQHQGGPSYAYRLWVSPPRPDFELRVTPSSINVRAGASAPITIHAIRRDGYEGEIELALKGCSAGYFLSGARVPANADKVVLTLTAPYYAATEGPFKLDVVGTGFIDGKSVERTAVPAEEMMQAFFYWHVVPSQELMADTLGHGGGIFRIATPLPLRAAAPLPIPAGGSAEVRVAAPGARGFSSLVFELSAPPDGISIKGNSSGPGYVDVMLACDGSKIKAGFQGNLILEAYGTRKPPAGQASSSSRQQQRIPLGPVPAIPFEVVPGA